MSPDLETLQWVALFGALLAAPVVAIMVTSFAKIAVVLAVLRAAIGVRGLPPSYVIFGLAAVLSAFIMAPVGTNMAEGASAAMAQNETSSEWERLSVAASGGVVPLQGFLAANTHGSELTLFAELRAAQTDVPIDRVDQTSLTLLVPAFVTTELKEAFLIGLLLFLPFLVIDLVVGGVLVSLGMDNLRTSAVAIPFKLLLFVLVDGWILLFQGLVQGYVVV